MFPLGFIMRAVSLRAATRLGLGARCQTYYHGFSLEPGRPDHIKQSASRAEANRNDDHQAAPGSRSEIFPCEKEDK